MARPILDARLQEIRIGIIHLATLVETALAQALDAIPEGDQALCGQVMASESTIDDLRCQLERFAFRSLTLQQPLGGRDIRFLTSARFIATDLERIGDHATSIASLLLRMAPLRVKPGSHLQSAPAVVCTTGHKRSFDHALTEDSIVCALLALGRESLRLLQGTKRAFEEGDTQIAYFFWQEDDVVDVRYHLVRHDVMTMLADLRAISALQLDPLLMQRLTYWLWIAHKFERVGDLCGKICERIIVNDGFPLTLPRSALSGEIKDYVHARG
jgi:phosphate transport system protein